MYSVKNDPKAEQFAGMNDHEYILPSKYKDAATVRRVKNNEAIPFDSEIDWRKWNLNTANNPELIKEYEAIEKATKADGTWMKNPDGSPFVGSNPTKEDLKAVGIDMTPEDAVKAQFICSI